MSEYYSFPLPAVKFLCYVVTLKAEAMSSVYTPECIAIYRYIDADEVLMGADDLHHWFR